METRPPSPKIQDSKDKPVVKLEPPQENKNPQPSAQNNKANTRAMVTWLKQAEVKTIMDSKLVSADTFTAWDKALESEKLPAAIIAMGPVYRNAKKLAAFANGKNLRVATKSLRVPGLYDEIMKLGPPFKGFMCYAVEEAAFLHASGYDDFLIAYPTTRISNLRLLRKMQADGATVALVIDSQEHMAAIAKGFAVIDRESKSNMQYPPLRVVIDVDMSYTTLGTKYGAKRSPINTADDLRAVLIASRDYPELKVVGAMGYEAVVAGLPDNEPTESSVMNWIKSLLRKSAIPDIAKRRAAIPDIFKELKCDLEIFNGGGTGSIDSTSKEAELTEITVGSGFLFSHLFGDYTNLAPLQLEPAAFFAVEAGRFPNATTVTCNGGGFIASGKAGVDRLPIPVLPGATLDEQEGCGEVQTPLVCSNGTLPLLGHGVFFRHAKAGELAEHFNEYWLANDTELVGTAKTYRGMGQCFTG